MVMTKTRFARLLLLPRISCQGTAWVYVSAVVEQQGAAVIPWEDRIPGRT
jgi:hypothetical protein